MTGREEEGEGGGEELPSVAGTINHISLARYIMLAQGTYLHNTF